MNTAIIVTLIICGTIVLLSLISAVGTIMASKKAKKTFDDISKEFFKED